MGEISNCTPSFTPMGFFTSKEQLKASFNVVDYFSKWSFMLPTNSPSFTYLTFAWKVSLLPRILAKKIALSIHGLWRLAPPKRTSVQLPFAIVDCECLDEFVFPVICSWIFSIRRGGELALN
jgi:hypothetical protein